MKKLSILLMFPLLICSCKNKNEFIYQNPIQSMDFRDTHIIPYKGLYYAVGTCEPYWGGKNPGVKLYVSKDLQSWEFEEMLIDAEKLDPDVWYTDRFWAPELREINGKFYLTFNCQNNSGGYGEVEKQKHFHACGIAVSDNITGPYKVMTHESPLTDFASNDLTLFQDDDGKVYAFFNNGWTDIHHIYVAELDLSTCRLKEEPVKLISQEEGKWDAAGIEGAHVIKKDGIYYLFYSSWTNGYAVGYATSDNIKGPWVKSEDNPLFGAYTKNDTTYIVKNGKSFVDPECKISEIGHNQIFIGPDGNYWTSYHGYLKGVSHAVTLIDPIWFDNGKIYTNTPTYSLQKIELDY